MLVGGLFGFAVSFFNGVSALRLGIWCKVLSMVTYVVWKKRSGSLEIDIACKLRLKWNARRGSIYISAVSVSC